VYRSKFPIFSVTVDVVALTILEERLCALVVRRGEEPFAGTWALPGGFVKVDEDLATAAARELVEETGILAGPEPGSLEQLATYGAPQRDPRGRTVSVAHLAVIPWAPEAQAGSDAADAEWRPVDSLPGLLAFDHERILGDGVERARSKLEYTNLATRFVPDEFTITELREVYDVIWGSSLDAGNFHRKVVGTDGFVAETGRRREGGAGRPARTFRAGPATALNPPLTRRSVQ
jgi:8-oxo-dGTP diphosphatase